MRECNVYSEIVPYTKALEAIREKQPKGIIFTGGPNSVYLEDSPTISPEEMCIRDSRSPAPTTAR